MKKIIVLIALIFLCSITHLSAEDFTSIKQELYKGKLNNKSAITLFFITEVNDCGITTYNAMYKYDGVSNWLLLTIECNEKKQQYGMLESGFTGALFLTKSKNTFNGMWYSPDRSKTFLMQLNKQNATPQELKKISDKFDEVYYEEHGC